MKNSNARQRAWLKMTIEESIIASLKKRIGSNDLEDEHWIQFKGQLKEGDEIWYYKSPAETWTKWAPLCGREGYALVSDDKVVDEILLAMS
jgi:hypothetical protein